ncbi:fumarylacetoacetate hydrolase family protein [Aeromicrobium wangtongii]|uniref:fumarylacetoacetate hydrolase family protein n=1 Tax=Aeromicrobium wangtongii TaxID=2969247 RepID=UPI002017EEC8|nr:fumarylacetoacetate hydrolase family protein [Aeromicrobium wangtongii]MCL3819397.1 fumarylacetoacetate hydrolase family protein [Aeromicrobium wangtongii]
MRITFYDDYVLGVVTEGGIVDVSEVTTHIPAAHPQDVINAVIAGWTTYGPRIEAIAAAGSPVPLSSVRLRAPLPRPQNIDCMAVNYIEDILPEAAPINGFLKSSSTVIGTGETFVLYDTPATAFEAEPELGIVIGKAGHRIAAADAFDHIFGYTNVIDGSARGFPPHSNSFYQMKSQATSCPIGPTIVTKDEVPDPQALRVRMWNNGVLKNDFTTADMAHTIARCVEFVSHIHPVGPGDVIATGTNHGGLHALHDGDVLILECEGLGQLIVNVQDDLRRTWDRRNVTERVAEGLPIAPPTQLTGKYAPAPA